VTGSKGTEGLEPVLRQMDATLDEWLKWARRERRHAQTAVEKTAHKAFVRGAGALRRQIDDLQAGLKKVSTGLERVERGQQPGPSGRTAGPQKVRKPRPATSRKARTTTRKPARKLKKAA
jgi:hypothetical protein